jgi:transposase-like protein
MARALSIDLGERAVAAALQGGLSRHRVAARFGAAPSTLICKSWDLIHRAMSDGSNPDLYSFKKTVIASGRDRPDIARRRAQWMAHQSRIKPERLVFIDETWTILRRAQDEHGAVQGMGAARRKARGQSSARRLENPDLCGCPSA